MSSPPDSRRVPVDETVVAQQPQPVGEDGVVSNDHTAVPARREVLQRMQAEASGCPEAPDGPAEEGCADRLGTVFEQRDATLGAQVAKDVHLRRSPPQMDGDHHSGLFGDRCLDGVGIDVLVRADVDQQRTDPFGDEGAHGGDEGVRHGDADAAPADAQGTQRQPQRVGARVDRDGLAGPVHLREGPFEPRHLLATDKNAGRQDASESRQQLVCKCAVLLLHVGEGHVHDRTPFIESGRSRRHRGSAGPAGLAASALPD